MSRVELNTNPSVYSGRICVRVTSDRVDEFPFHFLSKLHENHPFGKKISFHFSHLLSFRLLYPLPHLQTIFSDSLHV